MDRQSKRHLLTSALPYVNGVKHLGNLVGSMLPADAYARFLRARGEEVLFVCATDEHGTPAELAAEEAGLEVAEYCRRQHQAQARLGERFGLSFDVFGRSSSRRNEGQTQYFAQRLDEEGLLEARSTRQLFSPADGRFLPDRYVLGTCPRCGYELARGDQCERCGRLLDPMELIEPRSAISGSRELEPRETRHLFLLQSKLAERLRAWLEEHGEWPVQARSIGLKWLDEGLGDRSITRDLSWGVPVDRPGFEGKVFYVWFDAPIAYIGATREWADARGEPGSWRRWWRRSEDVHYVQFMAKDNVPFHVVGFPCTLLGSGEQWKLVDFLKAFNWLTYYGGKFSTSRGVGIFMDQALELLPADCWRYYLLANAPEADDVSFTWEHFALAVNKDLADTLGNFVNRSLAFAERRFGGEVPAGGEPGPVERQLQSDLDRRAGVLAERLQALEFRKAVAELRAIWSSGNAYFDRKRPWVAIEGDRDDAALTLRYCVNLVAFFARLGAPVIPFTAGRLLDDLGVPEAGRLWPSSFDPAALGPGHRFELPPVLFRKVTEDDVACWRERFGVPASADREAGLGVLEAQAPGRNGGEGGRVEEEHSHG
ncbi:MAG TPA: methionine--tRNA ligase [Solirubrobacterales bacterium]|nr:methionine--tRNA ligase [Solirubrobacterales bacterium]